MLQLSWIHGGVYRIIIKHRPSSVVFWDLNLTSGLDNSLLRWAACIGTRVGVPLETKGESKKRNENHCLLPHPLVISRTCATVNDGLSFIDWLECFG